MVYLFPFKIKVDLVPWNFFAQLEVCVLSWDMIKRDDAIGTVSVRATQVLDDMDLESRASLHPEKHRPLPSVWYKVFNQGRQEVNFLLAARARSHSYSTILCSL